ncbi:alpha/beta-hydrolase [Mollisia scopiformis]|uniref:Alpha/beta-hydrolase n=1 Tax=Mollisia scopiformis TaxID=149040 RepID=A0A194XSA1_MOLSC|nr:alpha/beta-hydrolase [Mollisia scopiformis]KUJ22607.1 alpha/beta-hydrolase [Mollisia scopiformis]
MAYLTIVFCHGAWHNVHFFDKVIAILEPLGYRCVTVPLPSASGRVPPTTSLDEDIAPIRSAVLKELDAGHDVLINAHSWGGIPASTALEGLTKPERLADGKTTGVIKMTYVAAFVLPEDMSLQDFVGGPQPTWIVDDDGNLIHKGDPRDIFYHDVDPKEADEWTAKLKSQSLASFTTKTTSAAWKKIPAEYLVCENDRAVPAVFQDIMIGKMKEAGADVSTTRLSTAHSPYLNKPDAVADFLKTSFAKSSQ